MMSTGWISRKWLLAIGIFALVMIITSVFACKALALENNSSGIPSELQSYNVNLYFPGGPGSDPSRFRHGNNQCYSSASGIEFPSSGLSWMSRAGDSTDILFIGGDYDNVRQNAVNNNPAKYLTITQGTAAPQDLRINVSGNLCRLFTPDPNQPMGPSTTINEPFMSNLDEERTYNFVPSGITIDGGPNSAGLVASGVTRDSTYWNNSYDPGCNCLINSWAFARGPDGNPANWDNPSDYDYYLKKDYGSEEGVNGATFTLSGLENLPARATPYQVYVIYSAKPITHWPTGRPGAGGVEEYVCTIRRPSGSFAGDAWRVAGWHEANLCGEAGYGGIVRVLVNPPPDVCSNISGNQASVPTGYYQSGGNCYLPVPSCSPSNADIFVGDQFDMSVRITNNASIALDVTNLTYGSAISGTARSLDDIGASTYRDYLTSASRHSLTEPTNITITWTLNYDTLYGGQTVSCGANLKARWKQHTVSCTITAPPSVPINTVGTVTLRVQYGGANVNPSGEVIATTRAVIDGTVYDKGGAISAGGSGVDYATSHTFTTAGIRTTTGQATVRTWNGVDGFYNPGTVNCPSQTTNVGFSPYMKVYGGDVKAGGTFDEAQCSGAKSYGGIYTFAQSTGSGYRGASSQFSITALLQVNEMYSASQRGAAPTPAKGLTLANDNAGLAYGGEYGGSGECITDYFGKTQDPDLPAKTTFPPPDTIQNVPADPPTSVVNIPAYTWKTGQVSNPSDTDYECFHIHPSFETDPGWNQSWLCRARVLPSYVSFWEGNGTTIPPGGYSLYTLAYNGDNAWGDQYMRNAPNTTLHLNSAAQPATSCARLQQPQDSYPAWRDGRTWLCAPPAQKTISNGTVPMPVAGKFDPGKSRFTLTGPTTIGDPGKDIVIPRGSQVALYVDGDLFINGRILYSTDPRTSLADIPNFALIVRGNIYISKDVTQLDGLYVAQPRANGTGGIIYTCAPGLSTYSPADLYNNCKDKQLSINGAVVAKQVRFLRVRSTVGNVTGYPEVPDFATGAGTEAGEVINFTPEMYLAPSALDEPDTPLSGNRDFQSIIGLPPVW